MNQGILEKELLFYIILGCKYKKNKPFITNIIGSISDKEEPFIIYKNEKIINFIILFFIFFK